MEHPTSRPQRNKKRSKLKLDSLQLNTFAKECDALIAQYS